MYIKNLSHISLSAKSLDNVKKFYVNLLNLKIIHEFRNKKNNDLYGIFFSSGKGTFLEFFKNKKKRKIGNVFRHLCFEVKDIKKIRKKLISLSPTLIKRGKTDKILQFFVKDLEHNVVEFHQRDKQSRF
jgi:catechol 2,3-dioxygenase-like lactoylglutathione lyase family enzyme